MNKKEGGEKEKEGENGRRGMRGNWREKSGKKKRRNIRERAVHKEKYPLMISLQHKLLPQSSVLQDCPLALPNKQIINPITTIDFIPAFKTKRLTRQAQTKQVF